MLLIRAAFRLPPFTPATEKYDLRVVAGHRPGHNVVHGVGKGQGQVMGFALAQHLGEITLGVYVKQGEGMDHRKWGGEVAFH